MPGIIRNLIEYRGISEDMPESSSVFKQLNVEETFCLPDAKPDIEQIVRAISELEIKSTRIIRTPTGVSLEGQVVTGHKVVIEGHIIQKIQYVADEPTQTVHGAHVNIPFSTFIVLPDDYIPGTPVTVNGYIEDVFVQKMDERCIFINITILLTADFC